MNPAKWTNDWWKGALVGGIIGALTGGTISFMWASGGTISLGLSGSNFYLPLFTFTPATAIAGGITTLSIGGGYGVWANLWYNLGKEYGPIHRYYNNRHKY